MKLCTKVRPEVTSVAGDAEIIDVSFVADDHEFGVDADGLLHIEGSFSVSSSSGA